MSNQIEQMAGQIIKDQAVIVGPLAWEEASKVTGLRVDIQNHAISIEGNSKEVLEKLVAQYERLFGPASREVCRDQPSPRLWPAQCREAPTFPSFPRPARRTGGRNPGGVEVVCQQKSKEISSLPLRL